jgi:hypothetical protein
MPIDSPKLNRMWPPRSHAALVALVVVGIAVFYQLGLREGHDWGGDFAMYLQHAQNIAEGRPYAEAAHVIDYNIPVGVGPPSYPPLFPLALAPTFALRGGLDWTMLKTTVVLFFAFFLLAIYPVIRRRLGDGRALVVLLLIGLSPYFWDIKDQILSDIPFALLVYLSLFLAEDAYDDKASLRRRIGLTLATALTVYLATATRALGVTLIASLIIFEVLRTRRPPVQALAVTALALALQWVQRLALGSTGGYARSWRFDPLAIVERVFAYPVELKFLFWNGYVNGVAVTVALIVTGLAIYGYVICLRRRLTLLEVFVVVYLGPVVLWPMRPNVRFMIPLVPLYFYYAFVGGERLLSRMSTRMASWATVALAVLIAGSYVAGYTRVERGRLRDGVGDPEAVALFQYVAGHAAPKDLYIFFKPRVLSFFSGARSAVSYYPAEYAELWDYYDRVGATHVIERVGDASSQALVAGHPDTFIMVYENADFRVHRIDRPTNLPTGEAGDHAESGEADPEAANP